MLFPKSLLLTALALAPLAASAQTHIQLSSRRDCNWNPATKQTEKCKEDDAPSEMVLNREQTELRHITERVTAKYAVQSRQGTLNDPVQQLVVRAGKKAIYTYVFDYPENRVTVYTGTPADAKRVAIFTVRRVWQD